MTLEFFARPFESPGRPQGKCSGLTMARAGGLAHASGEAWVVVLGCRAGLKMPPHYIPIFIYAALAAAFPAVTLIIFKYIRPDMRGVGAKLKPYECGIPPESDARGR